MKRFDGTRLLWGLALASVALAKAEGAEPQMSIRMRVIDQARVPDHVLLRAKEAATYILRQAGAEVAWLDCPLGDQDPDTRDRCNQPLGPADFWLHIVVRKLPGMNEDALGGSLLVPEGSSSAYVYYHTAEEFAKDQHLELVDVLGAAVVHEIGHLLLGEKAHARRGIMSTQLTPEHFALAKRGSLLFTPEQARKIRAEVMRRTENLSVNDTSPRMMSGVAPSLGRGRTNAANVPASVITLRVVNEASVANRTLLHARKEAAAILGRSGVVLVWLSCEAGRADWRSDNPCQRERGPTEFWLRIVTRRPTATSDDMLGSTELDEASQNGSAAVYHPAAVELAKKCQADVGQILGAAIAHEIGHLILGPNTHSPRGVMYPRWGPAQFELISISELSFTSDQTKLLHNEVRRRTSGSCAPNPEE